MRTLQGGILGRRLGGAVIALFISACHSATAPTSTRQPVLGCPASFDAIATSTDGAPVVYPAPTVSGGRAPVAVSCSPAAGTQFPTGVTTVECSATDAAAATSTCSFRVNVTRVPELSATRFLAFGDSVTAGEVTVPVTVQSAEGNRQVFRQVLVPTASYPSVLEQLLRQRYLTQAPSVANAGRPGEPAALAVPRFRDAMNSVQPDAVLLLMGYNDLGTSTTRSAGFAALETMAKTARGAGARVFLATLTPSIQGRQRSQSPSAIDALNASIRVLAAGEGAVLVDLYAEAQPDLDKWIGIDGLHPTEAGYARIGETFFTAIRNALERR